MSMKKILAIVVALFAVSFVLAAECVIVPRPAFFEAQKGKFVLSSKSVVYVADKSLVRPTTMFCTNVADEKGVQLSVVNGAPQTKNAISLSVDKSLSEEEYTLSIAKGGIVIKGGSEKGIFYALQSLRQVVFHAKQKGKKVVVDAMVVKDKPHFAYRGGMLDVCRYKFSVEEVKKFIDILALHKINRFHWHLTEDQGWRIEIKKYPELTKVGSMRAGTQVGRYSKRKAPVLDGKPYGGYFTQEEVRDIVRYASERYIEVIPEIDMPGHMVAALASYPELGCTKGPYEVRQIWGISRDILCAGRESTFEFVEGVLSEIVELFPSKYIHIGGDEAPKHRWKECPDCQKRIAEEGLKDEHELQGYFMKRVEKFLAKHGRSIIGWDEILEGGVTPTATVMAWRGAKIGAYAAEHGHEVVMSPLPICYFDFYQTESREGEGLRIGGHINFEKVYSWNPFEGISEEARKNIIGVQCNVWSEYLKNISMYEGQLLPRLGALCEVQWAVDRRNEETIRAKMESMRKFYDAYGWHYAPYYFEGRK